MKQEQDFLSGAIHVFLLCGLALAQPLYDLLGRGAVFFVVRRSAPIDVLSLVVLLSFLIPGALVLVEALAGRISRPLGRSVHYLLIGVLVAIFALPIAKRVLVHPWPVLAFAGAMGAVAVWAYVRFQPLRSPFSRGLLSLIVLCFPVVFILGSPVAKVVFPPPTESAYAEVDATTPVVMIVFDEFATTSLMGEDRQIDAVRYPHFAALARDATWYRNATAVSAFTHHAVPAILTGKYPVAYEGRADFPTTADHPNNLFTLLGGSYELKAHESITKLCPDDLCSDSDAQPSFSARLKSLLSDLHVVYLHVILPAAWTAEMPDVTRNWMDFREAPVQPPAEISEPAFMDHVMQQIRGERHEVFEQLVDSIDPSAQPALYFLHTLLPHAPYRYMPSGKQYGMDPGISGIDRKTKIWFEERSVVHAHQRYLLQVKYVDSLIGELSERLRAANLYDSSLIIITADHGVSFRVDDNRRHTTDTNYPDIVMVPLFIKTPLQKQGAVDDRNIELIDILPTIADALGISIPWSVDGLAADDPRVLERRHKTFFALRAQQKLTFAPDMSSGEIGLDHGLSLFGSGAPDEIFKVGPRPDLVGRRVDELQVTSSGRPEIELDCAVCYENIDPGSPFVFTHVTGTVLRRGVDDVQIAIAVNGKIQAVTAAFQKGRETKFSAVIPEEALFPGRNQIRLFSVGVAGGEVVLDESGQRAELAYSLSADGTGGDQLHSSANGTVAVVRGGPVRGHLISAREENHQVYFTGWAADVRNTQPVEAVVILEDGRSVFSGRTDIERDDLAKRHGEALRWSGFGLRVPAALFSNLGDSEIRLFAVSKQGVAAELSYPVRYGWGRKYALAEDPGTGSEIVVTTTGDAIRVVPGAFEGVLDELTTTEKQARISGWAADFEHGEVPAAIVVFVDGELFHADG